MDRDALKKILLNLNKYIDIEIEFKSQNLLVGSKLIDDDDFIEIYNTMPPDDFKKILKKLGYHRLTPKILCNLNNMDIILKYFSEGYICPEFLDSEKGKDLLELRDFYIGKSTYKIMSIYNEINNKDNKLLLIKKYVEIVCHDEVAKLMDLFDENCFSKLDNQEKEYLNKLSKDILNNIMGANEFEKSYIKLKFTQAGSLKTDDVSINFYNNISKEEFKALIKYCSVTELPVTLFDRINDKEKLIVPFKEYLIRNNILSNPLYTELFIDSDIFYDGIRSSNHIQMIFDSINDNLKQKFINNYIKKSKNIDSLFQLKDEEIIKYVNTDMLLGDALYTLIDKLISKKELDKKENELLFTIFDGGYKRLNPSKVSFAFYDKLPDDIFKSILKSFDIYIYSDELINSYDNIEKLVIPYNIFNTDLLKNEKYAKAAINSEIFYSERLIISDCDKIVGLLPTEELKYEFVKQLFKYKAALIKTEILGRRKSNQENKINDYITDDLIIDFIKNNLESNYLSAAFSKLSDDKKREIYESDWFREKYDLNNKFLKSDLYKVLPDDVILKDQDGTFGPSSMYKDTKRLVFLKLFIRDAQSNELSSKHWLFHFKFIFGIPDEQINELGEYRDKFFSLIDNMPNDVILSFFFEQYECNNQNSIVVNYIINRITNILENNDILIENLSSRILNIKDEKILDLICNNINKSDLLLLATRHSYVNMKVLKLLEENPNYFEGVIVEDISKYDFVKIDKNNLSNLFMIYNYLNYDQQSIYYSLDFLIANDELKERYINDIKNDCNKLLSINHFILFDEELVKNVIENINITRLMDLLYNKQFDLRITNIIKPYMSNRLNDIAAFLNDESLSQMVAFSKKSKRFILTVFDAKDIEKFINSITDISTLSFIYNDSTGPVRKVIENRLAYLIEINGEFSIYDNFPVFINKEAREAFYDKISFSSFLGSIYNHFETFDNNEKRVIEDCDYIKRKIDENHNLIYEISFTEKLNVLLEKFPNDLSLSIKQEIDANFEIYKDKYPKLIEYISSYSEKANLVGAIKNNYINDENIELVYQLLEGNKYLFNSMDFRLLQPNLLKMGGYFLNKTSRYPAVAIKVNKIHDTSIEKYNLLVKLSNTIRNEKNDSIYDQKMEKIINYLLVNDININKDINNINIFDIENYILDSCYLKNTKFMGLNVENYIEEKNKLIDKLIDETNDYNNLINLVFLKHFGINKKMVDGFITSYVENWNNVVELCENNIPNEYISLINEIYHITDVNSLKEISKKLNCYTLSDFMNVKGIMVNTYNKSVIRDLNNKNNGVKKEIIVGGKKIEVDDITDNFNLIIHSTDAYGSMPLINDNYYDSWNNNPRTKNHGICCSYISNTNYGTALVKSKGIMLAFDIEDENDIALYAPYDLQTTNDGYTIRSAQNPFFGSLKNISDFTRHSHNEFTIERRVNKNNVSELRQPKYIVIFEDMSDTIKQNSIKAYEDFKAKGIDIKLKYINRELNCHKQAEIITNMLNEYDRNFNLELLAEIINIHNSNICSCDHLGNEKDYGLKLFDQKELFSFNRIKKTIYNTIEYIKNIDDIEVRNNYINELLYILNAEQRKYDFITDFHKDRRHTFELIDEKIKINMYELKNLLDKEITDKKYK